MKFFLPDWDDRVDPGYDFLTDRGTLVRDPYRDDRYAHELIDEPLYDGILVSRLALAKAGPKRSHVDQVGMRAHLRLPARFGLLGDCGAYGYIREKDPPYEPGELVDYYARNNFDYGVSLDHVIVPEFDGQRQYRYDVTQRNAEAFLRLHRAGAHRFTPIGAIQGWDVPSYVAAAQALVDMGYTYIAVGGLARSNTKTVREFVTAVAEAVPARVRIHVFGVARAAALPLFLDLGIASADSATPLRQAWLDASDNYHTADGAYAAIRIPLAREERAKAGTLVGRSMATLADLQVAERAALGAVRGYAKGELRLAAALDAIMDYDELLAARRDRQTTTRRRDLYAQTLRDRPWAHCPCGMCRALGVEVVIFRGANRNRRRGFHNLWALRRRMDRLHAEAAGAIPISAHEYARDFAGVR